MRYVNRVTIIGNLTDDPTHKLIGENSLTTFFVATNRSWKDDKGERKDLVEYHNIAAWGGLADLAEKILAKSKLVYVSGYLKTKSWEENGSKNFRTEIVAEEIIALDKKKEEVDNY